MCQVLSASIEWSVISMLKEFTFVAILVSTYLTWHSTFLFKKTETKETKDTAETPCLRCREDVTEEEREIPE